MKDSPRGCFTPPGITPAGRRNPVARALIEQALGARAIPARKRYSRKAKHPKRIEAERE